MHRIKIEGADRVPTSFDKLIIVANHASYIDGVILWAYLRLPMRIVVDRTVAANRWLRPFLKNDQFVAIDFMSPYAIKDVVRMVDEGRPLLVFPEGRRTSTGHFMKIYDGTGFVAFRTGAHILPIYIKNTYNTFFAKKHKGRHVFAPITVTIGEPRPPMRLAHLPNRKRKGAATRAIYSMLAEVYLEAHNKPSTLGREFIRICSQDRRKEIFNDSTGRRLSRGKALAGAFALGRRFSKVTAKPTALAGSTVWLTGTRSGNVRAIVSYEPGSGFPFPEGEVPEALPSSAGPLVPLTAQLLGC